MPPYFGGGQGFFDALQSARGPYDSAFAPMPGGGSPVGPQGYGFGSQNPNAGTMQQTAPGMGSNMPMIGDMGPGAGAMYAAAQQPNSFTLTPEIIAQIMAQRAQQAQQPIPATPQGAALQQLQEARMKGYAVK